LISLENICAIEGIEKDELLEPLKVIFLEAIYLKEILGSNDESFLNSSNLPATLMSILLIDFG
jgi:hypothetical protein